nr:MAG TPA: hypothetical protein [Caudoviricetes sp.]DAY05886.1 MAG TPA: hypothetical protein [Caudoviricetes sp.]
MTTMPPAATPAATLDAIKSRLQSQQKTLTRSKAFWKKQADMDRLSVRAELDALWEAIEVLYALQGGIPIEHVKIHDYFTEGVD